MTRCVPLGLVSLLVLSLAASFVVGQGPRTPDLAGLWRQQSENGSVSFFELTPKEGDTYAAQEYGLGGVSGTARLEGGHLVIRFEFDGDKCHYTWHLRGVSGDGKFERTHNDTGEQEVIKSAVRFIGR